MAEMKPMTAEEVEGIRKRAERYAPSVRDDVLRLILEVNTLAIQRGHLDAEGRAIEKRKIVVICGSSKFVDVMAVVAWILERDEGAIVLGLHLLPAWYSHEAIPDHLAEHEDVAPQMDELHFNKIRMAKYLADTGLYDAEVFVVNVKHYIGESTIKEVDLATSLGLPIRWYTDDVVGHQVVERLRAFLDNRKKELESLAQ